MKLIRKRIAIFAFIMVMVGQMISCGESTSMPDAPELLYSTDSYLEFEVEGGYASFNLISKNIPWSVTKIPDWASVAPSIGSSNASPRVTVSANFSGMVRKDSLIINSTTSQYPAEIIIILSQRAK